VAGPVIEPNQIGPLSVIGRWPRAWPGLRGEDDAGAIRLKSPIVDVMPA